MRLRDAGASQGGSFLPARARARRPACWSSWFRSSWPSARELMSTRVASAAERAPQMAPEARGKVPPEMRQVQSKKTSNGGMGASGGCGSKQRKETSRQPQACPWRTRRATRSPYGARVEMSAPPQCSFSAVQGASSARGAAGWSSMKGQPPSGGRKSRPMMSMGQGKHGSTSPNPPEQWRTRR